MVQSILKRTLAAIILSISGSFLGGALMGLTIWQQFGVAVIMGLLTVLQQLAFEYVYDGNLTEEDIDQAFKNVAHNSGARDV